MHVGRVQVAAELFLRLTGEGSRRVQDLRPAAVVERHEQRDAVVAARSAPRPSPCARVSSSSSPSRRPMKRIRTPSSCSSGVSRSIRSANIAISPSTSSRRPRPVLGRERVDGQLLDAELDRVAQPRLDHVGARLGARQHRQPAVLRPARVPVHDDRDVARPRRFAGVTTSRISCFLALPAPSRSRRRARRSASGARTRRGARRPRRPRPRSSARAGRACTSRRMLRTATRPSSAMPCTTFTSSLRRSSVSSGIDEPDHLAVVDGREAQVGLEDRLLDRLDRGLVVGRDREQPRLGRRDAARAACSGVMRAVVVDLDRGRAGAGTRARCAPSRTRAGSPRRTCSCGSSRRPGSPSERRRSSVAHHRPHALAAHYPVDIALVVHVEDVDRQVVVHAQRQRRRVHHAPAAARSPRGG